MTNYTPTSGKCELHITYSCNLVCVNCNRFSFIHNPHTPDMSVEDVADFFKQCNELNWKPSIIIIGGEPTLHANFLEIVKMSREFNGQQGLVQVWSNGYSKESKELIPYIREKYSASVPETTFKTKSQILSVDDIYVSPKDFGIERDSCWQHSNTICGISVDSEGYMPCSIGGSIDAVLKLGLRTKRLADLFYNDKAAAITKKMCENCGHCLTNLKDGKELETWRSNVESCEKKYGAYMSPTWLKASEGMK